MRHLLFATALATVALVGLPATLDAAGTGSQSASARSTASGGETQGMPMGRDALRSHLEAAGFTNIEIVDAAYLVRARTQDGDQVVMFLDPPRQTASAQTGAVPEGTDQQTSGQQAAADQTTKQQAAADQATGQQAGGQQAGAGDMPAQSYRSFEQGGMDRSRAVSADLTGDEILGNEVVDQSGATIGTVSDLLVDQTDEVRAAVIEMDGQHVAVAVDKLEIEEGAGGQLALDMSRSQLEQQPRYEQRGDNWNLTHE